MIHYLRHIQNFAAPNGLCLSITESKHIQAVKKPWQCSSKNNALLQTLKTNLRLDKISTYRVHLNSRGMISGPYCLPLGLQALAEGDGLFVVRDDEDAELASDVDDLEML
jgi:hypothetical protein